MPTATNHLLAIFAFFMLVGPVAATAATIVVDTTDDVVADDGACSLREAILAANQDTSVDTCAAGDGEDEILLLAGTFAFAPKAPGVRHQYVVEGPVAIRGAGAKLTILDGMLLDRLFDVTPAGSLHLVDLTITNGKPPTPTVDEQVGGGGGAIHALGDLHIERCVLYGNAAGKGGPLARGGHGGAIMTAAPTTLLDSRLQGNVSGDGGEAGSMSYVGPGSGGAIYATGPLTIERTVIEENHLGIYSSDGRAMYIADGSGGAIHVTTGIVRVQGATITANVGGGVSTTTDSRIALFNSILAENFGTVRGDHRADCVGPDTSVTSNSANIFSPNGGCEPSGNTLIVDSLGLGPLTVNLKRTAPYLPLERSSPAVDAGSCTGLEELGVAPFTEDIRGTPRPKGETCDIGAYEYIMAEMQIRTSAEPASEACPAGGIRVEFGMDRNTNGRLDDDEVESSVLICHGTPGEDGDPGETGDKGDKGDEGEKGDPGENGEPGKDGVSCTVEHDDEGNVKLRCDDGTNVTLPGRGEGTSCTVQKTSQGGAKVICLDGSTATVTAPAPDGGSCTTAAGPVSLLGLLGAAWALSRRPRR